MIILQDVKLADILNAHASPAGVSYIFTIDGNDYLKDKEHIMREQPVPVIRKIFLTAIHLGMYLYIILWNSSPFLNRGLCVY
jgi:hypothetical protein